MKKLCEVAQLIRSKNAGPFMLTIDIIFPDRETYDRVLATDVLNTEKIAALCGVTGNRMKRFDLPLANAIKFSYPRSVPSGDFLDVDLYGCQQHRSLTELELPL